MRGTAPTAPAAPVWRCLLVWVAATVVLAAGALLGLEGAAGLADAPPGRPFDVLVVDLAGALAALVCPWLWVLTSVTVVDALRGRVRGEAGWWRRATLVACGCLATVTLGTASHAASAPMDSAPTSDTADTAGSTGSTGSAGALQGLPYPDRPVSGPAPGLPSPVAPTSTSPTASAPAPAAPPVVEDGAAPEEPDAAGASAGTTGSAVTHHDPEGSASRSDAHVVRSGDTLWAIARARLAAAGSPTSNAEVSRAVTALHLANREVVGDPDVILPGQRLAMDLHDPIHREDAR